MPFHATISCTDSFKLELHWENASLKWNGYSQPIIATHNRVCTGSVISAAALHMCLVLLTINVFFYPSLWRKLCPQCLNNVLYLLLVGNMTEIARVFLCSVFSPRLFVQSGTFYASFFVSMLSYAAPHFLIGKSNPEAGYLICNSHFCLLSDSCRNLFGLCRTQTIWKL